MKKFTVISLCLLLSGCEDKISLDRKDWRCSSMQTVNERICTPIPMGMVHSMYCRMTPIQQCLQWTKAK